MFDDLDAGFLFHLDAAAWALNAPDVGGRIVAGPDGPQLEPGTRGAGGFSYAAAQSHRRIVGAQTIDWAVYVDHLGVTIPMMGLFGLPIVGDPFQPVTPAPAFARFVADYPNPRNIGPVEIFGEYKTVGMMNPRRTAEPIVVLDPDTWHQFGIIVQPGQLHFLNRPAGGRGDMWNGWVEPGVDLTLEELRALMAIQSDGTTAGHLRVETRWSRVNLGALIS